MGSKAAKTNDFVGRLEVVLGRPSSHIALHEPTFTELEKIYVDECIRSGWVSSVGKFVDRFEAQLAAFTGVRRAVVVSNGTAALQVALTLAGVGQGDEVIVPTLSFVATANAVFHCGASPHFVDSDIQGLGMCPRKLGEHLQLIAKSHGGGVMNRLTGRRIGAIVPMHTFGHPVDMAGILDVATKYGLPVVEDAAESLGSLIGGSHTGSFGQLGILSFNGNKVVTTGGGGAILTNDDDLADRAKHLTTTAKIPHPWEYEHDAPAWNFRMPNLNAALGCAQMEHLAQMLESKRLLAGRYINSFSSSEYFEVVEEPTGCQSNYWLIAIRMKEPSQTLRNSLIKAASDAGFGCRPAWNLLHTLPMYRNAPSADLTNAQQLLESLINVPSSACLVPR